MTTSDIQKEIADRFIHGDLAADKSITYRVSHRLRCPYPSKVRHGMTALIKLLMEDVKADVGVDDKVQLLETTQGCSEAPPLFMIMERGEQLICLDPPFLKYPFCAGDIIQYDNFSVIPSQQDIDHQQIHGMPWMTWAMKYRMGEGRITVGGFGLVFLYFCDHSTKVTKSFFAHFLKTIKVHENACVAVPNTVPTVSRYACTCGAIQAECSHCHKGYAQVYNSSLSTSSHDIP